ncbi:MAG TPA: cytochrome c [Polyangiaceae bacterium]|nr:cytochrome c [Polyangiaceae bacterium]
MQHIDIALVLGTLALATACGGSPTDPKSGDNAAKAPASFSEQVTRGGELFGDHCSSCHGKGGEGTAKAPPVVGPKALPLDPPSGAQFRKSKFVTVADVADFVTKNMPADAPGSLSEEDYFAVLAFDLHANGIDLDKKLDAGVAASLTIPRD